MKTSISLAMAIIALVVAAPVPAITLQRGAAGEPGRLGVADPDAAADRLADQRSQDARPGSYDRSSAASILQHDQSSRAPYEATAGFAPF